MQQAEKQGVDSYALLDQAAAEGPIGSNRLIYLPYLMGERTPHLDPDCRGAFVGLSGLHTRYDLLRAVMEGVTYSLGDCAAILDEMGVQPDVILACGGGGTSPLWRQMLADVLRCPVATTHRELFAQLILFQLIFDILRNSAFVLSCCIHIVPSAPKLSAPILVFKLAELLI